MNHDDDLTASHWDDVFSGSQQGLTFASGYMDPEFNGFSDLSLANREPESHDDSSDESPEESQPPENTETNTYNTDTNTYNTDTNSYNTNTNTNSFDAARAELEQMHELKKEQRQLQKSRLMGELADSLSFDQQLEQLVMTPEKLRASDPLFDVGASPIKIDFSAPKSDRKKFRRPRKFAPNKNASHLSSDPLGPLGIHNKLSDNLSVKSASAKDELVKESEAPLYDLSKDVPKPVEVPKKQQKPQDTDRNLLDITVSDPMKVGDITNAHIVYTITTKNKNLGSGNFPPDPEYLVARRYKDFRWIYHQLQNNHLGKIIPPPPSKQTYIGRFNESFIENRRLSLEKMLAKINSIPELSKDQDFIMFLTSQDFANESKERERISGSGASLQNNDSLDNPADTSTANSGFMSSIFSISNKTQEPDEFFDVKRHYIESLETNLKSFHAAIEVIINQRAEIVSVVEQITLAIEELSSLEISKKTSELLTAFNDVQIKLRDNLDRVNLQDHLTLGFTIEEYLRTIGSIKYVFDQRLKIYQSYQNNLADLNKKKSLLTKYKLRNQVDKVNLLNFEIEKLQAKTDSFENRFNTVSETIKLELENFEFEKVDDFRNSVEIYIESSIESQKENIEIWETFYERQGLSAF